MSKERAIIGRAVVGPIAFRSFEIEGKCETSKIHAHKYDHTTLVLEGAVTLQAFEIDGHDENGDPVFKLVKETHVRPSDDPLGRFIYVPAGVYHCIKAATEKAAYACIFSHRDTNGLVVEQYQGNQDAYL